MNKALQKVSFALFLASALWVTLLGQGDSDIPKVTSAYALQNAYVVVEPGNVMENVTVFIEDGVIQMVGSRIPIPVHAQLIPCDSMYIYAGFIEGISHTGIPKKDEDKSDREEVKDPGNPPNDLAGITPERSAAQIFSSNDKSVKGRRELGFTLSHVVPENGMLPGKGALILLGDGDAAAMTIKDDVSLFLQLTPARRMYPATLIGVMSKWREMYRQADYLGKHKEAYAETSGMSRPKYDMATEALFPVVSGDMPVFFKAQNALHVHKALALQEELGFDLVLAEVNQAWRVADAITERDIAALVTMELPDEPKEQSKGDDEDEEMPDDEREALAARRDSSLAQYERQAATLSKSGARLAFSMLEVKDKDFKENLLRMVDEGLSPDTALAALTTYPAEIFDIQEFTGTVEAGKMANLVVSTGPYFDKDSQVKYVFVEGQKFEYDAKKKKKKKGDSDGEVVSVAGKWSYEVEVMGSVNTGTLDISGDDGDFSGSMTSDDSGETTALENISVDGGNISFSTMINNSGMDIKLDFDLEIIDGTFEGNVTAGQFGTFEIEGEKIPDSLKSRSHNHE